MSISVKIPQSQITKAINAFSKYNKAVEARVSRAKAITAINVERKAKENVTTHGERPTNRNTRGRKGPISTKYLVWSGEMRRRITQGKTVDGETAVGTNIEYAIHHEFGAPRANIPKRAFLLPAAESERQPHRKRMIEALKPQ